MFFPTNFSNIDDYLTTRFTCPHCGSSVDLALPQQSVVHGRSTVPGAKSQFGPVRYPLLFPIPYKFNIKIPLNLWAHVDITCASCGRTVTAYFDCQAGGRHGETLYAIAAVRVGDDYIVDGFKSPPPERDYPQAPRFDPAIPTAPCYSKVWFDGGQWEMSIPEGWGSHYRGGHEFSTDYGATLRLGVAGWPKLQGFDRIKLPTEDMPEHEQVLYRMTKMQADNFHGSAPLERQVCGAHTGYWYRSAREDGKIMWCGYVGDGVHSIYVSLTAPAENESYCLDAARFMLASLHFHTSQVGPPSSPAA